MGIFRVVDDQWAAQTIGVLTSFVAVIPVLLQLINFLKHVQMSSSITYCSWLVDLDVCQYMFKPGSCISMNVP